MAIERGHATGAAPAVTQRPGGGKAAAPAEAGGDFLAMLSALDMLVPADALPLQGEGADGQGRAPWAADEGVDPAQALPADGAAALAAAAAATPSATATAAPGTPAGTVDGGRSGAPAAVEAAAAARAAQTELAPEPATARAASAAATPAALAPEYASVFEQLKHRLAAQEAAAPLSSDAALPGARGMAAAAQAAQREARAERGFSDPTSTAAWMRAEPVAAQAQVFDAMPARSGPRGEERVGAARGESTWAPQEFTPTVQYDATLGSVDAPPPPTSPDQPWTEQLRYWVSQGMRSAELTLQGDADPVQVSVSMQGNEAHVAFRSEHAATRDMLAGALDQLRDLLQAQGMVLSGVSVGAHDAGAGRGGQPADAEARTRAAAARVAGAQATPVDAAPAAARNAAGGLDLYV